MCCALPLCALEAFRPSEWVTRVWQTDDGLPDNRIASVLQTADGYLWVATLGGLMRFDGMEFEEQPTFPLTKLSNQNVRGLLQDRRGRVWMVMDLGMVLCVDGSQVTKFDINEAGGNSALRAMAEDGEGSVWIVRRNAVLRIRDGRVEPFGEKDGLPSGDYAWGAVSSSGEFWFARGPHVGVFRAGTFHERFTLDAANLCLAPARDGSMWIVTPTQILKCRGDEAPRVVGRFSSRMVVRTALEDRDGALWIGTTSAGLLRWCDSGIESVEVPRPQVSALAEDREGNLWAGTDGGGVCRVRTRAIGYVGDASGLPKEAAKTLCQDAEGHLWAVLQYGSLASECGGQWHVMTKADGWPQGGASCVAPARDGGVWVGMMDKGLFRWHDGNTEVWGVENGYDIRSVRSLLTATNGDVWVVTDWPNRLRVFRQGRLLDLKAPKNMQAMIALEESPDGTIWAGTSNGQLFRVQDQELVCEEEATPSAPSYVRSLHAAKDGSLWIGYGGSGLGRWRAGRYVCISVDCGLADRFISQILSDDAGRLWMTGNHGLFCAGVEDLNKVMDGVTNRVRCVTFGRGEGLSNLQPMWQFSPTGWRTREGGLYFAVGSGLLAVRPDAIRENPVAPLLALDCMRVDGRLIAKRFSGFSEEVAGSAGVSDLRACDKPLLLPPDHDKLEFEFTALSFSSPENVQFRYRLSGFDREWVEGGTQRSAKYPRLSAGHYEFHVTACNDIGVWNDTGVGLAFIVQPFFWQTWWFRLLLWTGAAALLTGVTGVVLRRHHQAQLRVIEHQRAIEHERSRIAQDMHDQLGSGLTKANMITEALRRESGVSGARYQMLRETLERLTVTMDELVWAVNPRHDTLDGLANYVVRYTQEFLSDTEIACVLDVPADLPVITLSAPIRHNLFLAFEEALSNAARHAGATEVTVRMAFQEGRLTLEVADNGSGFLHEHVRAGAQGLANMRQRLTAAGGRCEVETAVGKGTRIRFELEMNGSRDTERGGQR